MVIANQMGDLEIVWSEKHADDMRALVEKKIAEGYRFFVLKPRLGGLIYTRKFIKNASELKENSVRIDDADIVDLLSQGKIKLARRAGKTFEVETVSIDPVAIARTDTVAVRQLRGG